MGSSFQRWKDGNSSQMRGQAWLRTGVALWWEVSEALGLVRISFL